MQLRNCTKKKAHNSCEKNQEQGSDGQEKGRTRILTTKLQKGHYTMY